MTASATPEREMSMILHRISRPLGNVSVVCGIARNDAVVPTILGHSEFLPAGEPSELVSELFALERGQGHGNRETAEKLPTDDALYSADLRDIGDDLLAQRRGLLRRRRRCRPEKCRPSSTGTPAGSRA